MSTSFDTPLEILGGISAEVFLRDYWQKKPLLIRQAIPDFINPIDGNDLAGLSLEELVESRIILEHGETPWQLKQGPFDEDTYNNLPERDWTLLVQAVDQFSPEVAQILAHFQFLPSWRIDDVMISYAAPGGSVGPHFDNYDVFLLQTDGQRTWKTGQMCDADTPLLNHPDLRILDTFEQVEEWTLEPGDMLYLPPRLAHWGIAKTECMTWSVGFRAPSSAEVISHYADFVARFLPDEQRYSDANMSPIDNPSYIRPEDIQRLRQLLNEQLNDDRILLTWFGQYMTEPRYPELFVTADIDTDSLLGALQDGVVFTRNPTARLAWSHIELDTEPAVVFFVSGNSRVLSEHLAPLLDLLCNADALHTDNLTPWLDDQEAITLICELIKQGSLECIDD
ncbi:cupin domain-containing protein [Denitrificimonas sp. JX-1]|uniref:Cupin domain-containing protein n=1 Tax=Denitrificimonas halotolerans TaxID=3098930 RepID=A0ABU5GQV6_9GAMM|nr:cupin domain-containing protein [Denitrificimonas sp. JX-1]MDY7219169.1 cupin domain-containing protein [Denitrificimonas sp. JX-1]